MRFTLPRELDSVAELSRLALDLDTVVEELLEGSGVENVVVRGNGVVHVELVQGLARVFGGGSGLGLRCATTIKRTMSASASHRSRRCWTYHVYRKILQNVGLLRRGI